MTDETLLERLEHEARVHLVLVHDWDGPIVFTCEGCAAVNTCDFAYDEWNLNGDCIMDK